MNAAQSAVVICARKNQIATIADVNSRRRFDIERSPVATSHLHIARRTTACLIIDRQIARHPRAFHCGINRDAVSLTSGIDGGVGDIVNGHGEIAGVGAALQGCDIFEETARIDSRIEFSDRASRAGEGIGCKGAVHAGGGITDSDHIAPTDSQIGSVGEGRCYHLNGAHIFGVVVCREDVHS